MAPSSPAQIEKEAKQPSGNWYHGSPERHDTIQTRTWSPHGGPAHEVAIFLSQDKGFAKLYAGHHGFIYTVHPHVHKTFDSEDLWKSGARYIDDRESFTEEGTRFYDDLVADKIFPGMTDPTGNTDPVADICKSVSRMDYDTMENGHMVAWLRKNGYDSFYVTGDGPKNLAVFDPRKIEIVDVVPVSAEIAAKVAARFAAETAFFKPGDPILFGKYKNKRGIIVRVFEDEKGHPSIEVQPVPQGRKKNKVMGLYKIWHDPDPPGPEDEK